MVHALLETRHGEIDDTIFFFFVCRWFAELCLLSFHLGFNHTHEVRPVLIFVYFAGLNRSARSSISCCAICISFGRTAAAFGKVYSLTSTNSFA